jgi:hypothetical protein
MRQVAQAGKHWGMPYGSGGTKQIDRVHERRVSQ